MGSNNSIENNGFEKYRINYLINFNELKKYYYKHILNNDKRYRLSVDIDYIYYHNNRNYSGKSIDFYFNNYKYEALLFRVNYGCKFYDIIDKVLINDNIIEYIYKNKKYYFKLENEHNKLKITLIFKNNLINYRNLIIYFLISTGEIYPHF